MFESFNLWGDHHSQSLSDNQSKMAAQLCVYFDVFIESATSIIQELRGIYNVHKYLRWGRGYLRSESHLLPHQRLTNDSDKAILNVNKTECIVKAGLCKFDFENCVMNIL